MRSHITKLLALWEQKEKSSFEGMPQPQIGKYFMLHSHRFCFCYERKNAKFLKKATKIRNANGDFLSDFKPEL